MKELYRWLILAGAVVFIIYSKPAGTFSLESTDDWAARGVIIYGHRYVILTAPDGHDYIAVDYGGICHSEGCAKCTTGWKSP